MSLTIKERKRILHSSTVLGGSTFVAIERSAVKRYAEVMIVSRSISIGEGMILLLRGTVAKPWSVMG